LEEEEANQITTPATQVTSARSMSQVPILTPVAVPEAVNDVSRASHNIDKDGFQKVVSKNVKKNQKPKVVSSSYPIRSRVGTSKSLK